MTDPTPMEYADMPIHIGRDGIYLDGQRVPGCFLDGIKVEQQAAPHGDTPGFWELTIRLGTNFEPTIGAGVTRTEGTAVTVIETAK